MAEEGGGKGDGKKGDVSVCRDFLRNVCTRGDRSDSHVELVRLFCQEFDSRDAVKLWCLDFNDFVGVSLPTQKGRTPHQQGKREAQSFRFIPASFCIFPHQPIDQDKMEFCHDFQNGRCNRSSCRCDGEKVKKKADDSKRGSKKRENERERMKEKETQLHHFHHMPGSSIAMVMLRQSSSILVIFPLV